MLMAALIRAKRILQLMEARIDNQAQAAAGGPEQQQPGPEAFEGGEQADGEEDGKVTLGKRQRIWAFLIGVFSYL